MIAVDEQVKKAILGKMRTIKKPPKALSEFLGKAAGSPLRDVLRWLLASRYDTFICNDVVALLGAKVNDQTDRIADALKGILSSCLSCEPCSMAGTSAERVRRICSHVERPCDGHHVALQGRGDLTGHLNLLSLILWAGAFPKNGRVTLAARGGGDVGDGEVSAMGVDANISDTFHDRGHHSSVLKRCGFNDSIMFTVAQVVARAASGTVDRVTAVCTQGRHRSRLVTTLSGVVLKSFLHNTSFKVSCLHNGS